MSVGVTLLLYNGILSLVSPELYFQLYFFWNKKNGILFKQKPQIVTKHHVLM